LQAIATDVPAGAITNPTTSAEYAVGGASPEPPSHWQLKHSSYRAAEAATAGIGTTSFAGIANAFGMSLTVSARWIDSDRQ
jgi:hypothetical protein